jgi:hypothetical protein
LGRELRVGSNKRMLPRVNTALTPIARWAQDRRVLVGVLLGGLLLLDGALILYNLVGERPLHRLLRLGVEWRLPEIYEYVKLAAAALVMLVAWAMRRLPLYAAWTVALLILLADNALQVHEQVAATTRRALGISQSILGPINEAVVLGAIAGLVLIVLVLGYRATSDPAARRFTRHGFVLLVALGLLAVGGDLVHKVVGPDWKTPMALIEEGGELVVMSLLLALVVWHVLGMTLRDAPPAAPPPSTSQSAAIASSGAAATSPSETQSTSRSGRQPTSQTEADPSSSGAEWGDHAGDSPSAGRGAAAKPP